MENFKNIIRSKGYFLQLFQLRIKQRFTNLRKSSKGNPLSSVFHQVLCFFINGENFHLTHFDHQETLKNHNLRVRARYIEVLGRPQLLIRKEFFRSDFIKPNHTL